MKPISTTVLTIPIRISYSEWQKDGRRIKKCRFGINAAKRIVVAAAGSAYDGQQGYLKLGSGVHHNAIATERG
ncbi:hypothetical protein GCM10020370_45960 [Paenibacillus hodogayensis]